MDELGNSLSWQDVALEGVRIAGPVGVVIVALAALAYFVMRRQGWAAFGDKDRMVSTARLDAIDGHLGKIDGQLAAVQTRLSHVEGDLEDRPTRTDLHQLQVSMARQDERIIAIERTTTATNASVGRIEAFLLDMAKRNGGK